MSRRYAPSVLLLAAVACSQAGPAGPDQRGGARLAVIAGSNLADTALSVLPGPLTVEVHDSTGSLAAAGTVVRFEAVPYAMPTRGETYEVTLGPDPTHFYAASATVETDQAGRSSAYVRLGRKAGTSHVVISVPALGLVDTARYTVTHGAPTILEILPFDTAVTVGHSVTLRVGEIDQNANPITDGPRVWNASNPVATVDSTGTVFGATIGSDTITLISGRLSAHINVSVVPPGRLAVSYGTTIGLMNLDGGHVDSLASAAEGPAGYRPQWMPDGESVVYVARVGDVQTIERVDTATRTVSPFFPSGIPGVTDQTNPVPTYDGTWLFFAAHDSTCVPSTLCLYRSRIDGSSPLRIGTSALSDNELTPSPSPDGSLVAFVQKRHIKVYDVANAQLTSVDVAGMSPTWSHDGSTIAYVAASDSTIMGMAPDGTGQRALSPGRPFTGFMMSWSADDKYIMAMSNSGMWRLIDVQTGASIQLPVNEYFGSLAFH